MPYPHCTVLLAALLACLTLSPSLLAIAASLALMLVGMVGMGSTIRRRAQR